MSRDEAADRRVSAVDYCALESTPYGFAQVSRGFAQVSRVVSRRYRAGIAGIADIAGFAEVSRGFAGFAGFVPRGIARYRKVSRVILYGRHWLHVHEISRNHSRNLDDIPRNLRET